MTFLAVLNIQCTLLALFPPLADRRLSSLMQPILFKSMSESNKQKRKLERLEKLKIYGVDLPDIRGLPEQVIPLHAHALKKALAFFRTSSRVVTPLCQVNNSMLPRAAAQRETRQHVMDGIFGRIEQQHQQIDAQDEIRTNCNPQRSMQQAIQSWLNAIHQLQDSKKSSILQRQSSACILSVPLASFEHLFSMVLDQNRTHSIATRRAALHLAAQLLWKSSDCRKWLFEVNRNLALFIDIFTSVAEPQRGPRQTSFSEWNLIQQEAHLLLKTLVDNGYQKMYPTLTAGLQRFRQQCLDASSEANINVGSSDMQTWRLHRDTALDNYQVEVRRVRKLVRQAYACIDVIVPRLISNDAASSQTEEIIDDDDESAVDWEDGFNDELSPIALIETDLTILHAAAVERTLVGIQSIAALRNGGIEIGLDNAAPVLSANDASTRHAKLILKRCLELLTKRHMPRLSAWIEGLIKADNLVSSKAGAEGSLVAMPRDQSAERAVATRFLMDLKQTISRVFASGKKFETDTEEASVQYIKQQSQQRIRPPGASSIVAAARPSKSKIRITLKRSR
ncbi:hypothetical protein MPSEU_000897300 [Mayamaea pseudoterrestris]|nr:hypothetical protein MPSEU_000897300 [Mayamaea pseudoterrestris]